MSKAQDPPVSSEASSSPSLPAKVDAAFDVWLQRGLHELYDRVAKEPIPADLLRLIEEDRNR